MMDLPADHLIVTAAFRYALGRKSYMVEHVAAWIGRHADAISGPDRELIVREIDEAGELGGLGMDVDEAAWRKLQEKLRTSPHAGEAVDV